MANSLKRPISFLLILLLIISALTVLPAATAGAAADTSDPWIFAVNDGRTYDLDGKWVRYGDDDFQLSGEESFSTTSTSRVCTLQFGTTEIAKRNIWTGLRNPIDTMYVTGLGTQAHPYIFTPNIVFGKSGGTFASVTVFVGNENLPTRTNDNNDNNDESFDYIAVPGDGFTDASRMWVGAENYVCFTDQGNGIYQPNPGNGYAGFFGVKQYEGNVHYGMYNGSSQFTNNTTHFPLSNTDNILYYLGRTAYGENNLYTFSESIDKRDSFTGENSVFCTVTWEDQDGFKFRSATYSLGETPSTPSDLEIGGTKAPEKAVDAAYTYTFTGFEPAYEPLTDDMTYVATYNATPKGSMTYSVDAWIFPTNDGKIYDELAGMCYTYGGSTNTSFPTGGSFSVVDNQILLCGVVVADIDTSQLYKTFANTVYVTGAGTQADPFVFTPNYIYSDSTKTQVKDGISIAIDSEHFTSSVDKGIANPGDGFKGMSRIRVYNNSEQNNKDLFKIQFLQQNGLFRPSRYFLGVGENTYGYRYSTTKALPFSFVSDDRTLYYFEKTESGVYQFSETNPPMRYTFLPSSSTIYTVTWMDDDNRTVLDEETYYVGVTPTYKDGTPTKAAHDQYTYTFSGWSPAISPVKEDVTYTATYTQSERLFCYHSLTLNGDIGLNFYLNVDEATITTGSGVVVDFAWNVEGTPKSASAVLDKSNYITKNSKRYYKATVSLPAAEMTYQIHASAKINGVLQSETDIYRIKDYADVILTDSAFAEKYTAAETAEGRNGEQRLADLRQLVNTMLDYGAKAQIVFGRNTGDLANKGIDYSMPNVSANDISTATIDMDTNLDQTGLSYYSASVVFLSKSTLRYYFTIADQSKFNAVKSSVTFDGTPVTYQTKGSYIYFDCPDIAAAKLDEAKTIQFGELCSYSYSVLDHIRKLAENGGTQADLAKAMYCYNQAANTYFPNS